MFEGAACVAAGLFPPMDDQKWDQSLDWQPVDIEIDIIETNHVSALFYSVSVNVTVSPPHQPSKNCRFKIIILKTGRHCIQHL